MKKIEAIIDKTSDGYCVYTENSIFSGMGDTAEEAKKDMMEQIEFYMETCKETGYSYPAFLDEEYEIVYKFNVQSLLEFYDGIITNAALERLTGINQKQLWAYSKGKSKPRVTQKRRIEKALHTLGRELLSISL